MEDWKKKYEEITKRVKELHESGNALTKLQMEVICPELKEGEDERIRREIRNFLIDMECKESWISYLEKQKEQKPLSTEETELNSIAFLEQLGYTCIPPGAEQMDESKEWADELSAEIDRISKRYPEVSFAKLSRVAVHFVRWQKEQKPTNSENPKEWSEEDALCLEKALNAVYQVYGLNGPTSRWLKSIRPQSHWKPSEEQMEALMLAIEGKWEAILPTGYMSRRLEDLYNDLKKLM